MTLPPLHLLGILESFLLFAMIYFQVFLLLTLFEKKDHMGADLPEAITEGHPSVTILVPVFNEEKTVEKTIHSLLGLNYPQDQLNIMIIDDGSKDSTWSIIQKFKDHPQIQIHKKENGGKYTALNYGITHCTTEFVGCLDADSFVDPEALNHIIPYFSKDKNTMAVTPSMKIQNPDSMLGLMQNAEYNLGIFTRKIFSLLDAQYVTPGPFSIFRREVFNKVGPYKHAHNTEDLEMAFRLQEKHYKIVNAHKAIVYTVAPPTLYKLYKQRVRWTGGFIQNVIDYRKMVFNREYGNFGLLVLPSALLSIVGTIIFLCYHVYTLSLNLSQQYGQLSAVDWQVHWNHISWPLISRDWWYYHLESTLLLGIFSIACLTFAIWYGKSISGAKDKKVVDVLFFLVLYSFISPIWLITSVYNAVRQRDAAWR